MKGILRDLAILVIALLASILFGIFATRASADGPVLWKQGCPQHYEVRQEPSRDGGVTVYCVRMAEDAQQ